MEMTSNTKSIGNTKPKDYKCTKVVKDKSSGRKKYGQVYLCPLHGEEESLKNILLHFCELYSIKCSCCDKLDEELLNIMGMETAENWMDQMNLYGEFVIEHKSKVPACLRSLEPEWKDCCNKIRKLILQHTREERKNSITLFDKTWE
jgi:hypothetical protein